MDDKYEMGLAAANIVLTGGNVKFPNFEERFYSELRPLVPDIYPIQVSCELFFSLLFFVSFMICYKIELTMIENLDEMCFIL